MSVGHQFGDHPVDVMCGSRTLRHPMVMQGQVTCRAGDNQPVCVYIGAVGDAARARMVTTRMWTLKTNTHAGTKTQARG